MSTPLSTLNRIVTALAPYAKAVTAAGATLVAIGAALADGGITAEEWAAILAATGLVSGSVYAVPNKPKAPADGGAVSWFGIIVVALLIAIVLILTGNLDLTIR